MKGFDCTLGFLWLFELNVGVASALFAVRICLQLARDNVAESLELIKDLLLRNIWSDVFNKEVWVFVEARIWLRLNDSESETHESLIIHLLEAAISFTLVDELKIAVASRLVSLSVNHNLSILDFEALASEELIEVKVEEVFLRKIAHVQARQLVHALLSLLVIGSTSNWVGPWLVQV